MKRSFWFHYNKPESRKVGRPQITIHYMGSCHIVENLKCNVSVTGRVRKTQPFWVICGKTSTIDIVDGIATIS